MKKVLSFTLVSLALAALCAPAHAGQFGGSVRGDVGALGSQVPYLAVRTNTGVAPNVVSDLVTYYSDRKDAEWDFTGRVFFYTSCAPCGSYIAGSWQGSNHTVSSSQAMTESATVRSSIPIRGTSNSDSSVISPAIGSPVVAAIDVRNEFSKAKLGMGFDLIKTSCFAFTMEVGANYLNAELESTRLNTITQTVDQDPGSLVVSPNTLYSAGAQALPYDYVVKVNTNDKTEGAGLYAMFKGEYKFPSSCLGNCFSIYGKAEIADIIGRQTYSYTESYTNSFSNVNVALATPVSYLYTENPDRQYNNIVEVDIEAAFVYSPCFRCWDNLNMNFALGVRTDSFVNLFAHPVENSTQSVLSLTRPSVFLEVGIKI